MRLSRILCALTAFSGLTQTARADDKVTFARDIAPIIYQNCSVCHRPGAVAPFSLLSYDDAKKRAKQIAVVTQSKFMPPWKAEPGHGEFRNERTLNATQIKALAAWASQGAPEGDPKLAPAPPVFKDGWQLGKPDLIIKMSRPYAIPADGKDIYHSFPITVSLPSNKFVRATEFRPGNSRIVHHATVVFDKSGEARKKERANGGVGAGYPSFGGFGFIPSGGLAGYVPGEMPALAPEDAPSVLPQNVDIVLGMHYHPSGKVESDQSMVGIYVTDKPAKRVPTVLLMGTLNIEIQPGEKRHKETTEYTLPVNAEIQGIGPHMHLIGKECRIWAVLPNGTETKLVLIKDWDFNWQGTYYYKNPFVLPKGTKIYGEWYHDNTADNSDNPYSPPRVIKNGENSTDEMAGVWINVIVANDIDNLILWGANIEHLVRASLKPPQRAKRADLSQGINGSALLLMTVGTVGAFRISCRTRQLTK